MWTKRPFLPSLNARHLGPNARLILSGRFNTEVAVFPGALRRAPPVTRINLREGVESLLQHLALRRARCVIGPVRTCSRRPVRLEVHEATRQHSEVVELLLPPARPVGALRRHQEPPAWADLDRQR